MSILKNKSLLLVFTVILLILLPLLGILQYRWLNQISLSEHERMKVNLRTTAIAFSREFNRRINSLNFCFSDSLDYEEICKNYINCYESLNKKGTPKKLVRDIFFINFDKNNHIRNITKANLLEKRIEEIKQPPELANLCLNLENKQYLNDITAYNFKGTDEEIPALINPIIFSGSDYEKLLGVAVVTLNLHYLKYEFIPNLAKYYFGNGENLDYNLTFVNKSRPTEIIYQSLQQTQNTNRTSPTGDVVVKVLAMLFEDLPKEKPVSNQESESFQPRNTDREYITSGKWLLVINHPEGSLEQAVTNIKQRNLAVGTSILLLLFGSLIMFCVSTHRAQTLAKQKVEFVTAMSHELRTPLAVIRSASENLSDGIITSPKDIKEYGEMINHEVSRLTDMVEQAIEFARIQKGWKPAKLHPIEIEDLINSVIKNLGQYIKENKVELETTIQPSLPIIKGDWSALYRCVQNLISNAIKYSKQNRHISLIATCSPKENFLQIIVKDNGLGINKSELSHIFDPFYRSQQVVAEQIPGSGLGLSLVKNVIEAHGGRVTVESTLGKGSSFTLHLPVLLANKVEENLS